MNTKQMLKIAIAATVVITNIASLPHVVYAKDVTNQSTSTAEIQSEVETLTNTVPTITGATEITIKAGDVFDVLTGISASDSEDGDLTSSIKVEGSVNPNEEGSYSLTYSVTDQDDNTTTIERKVTVISDEKPTITGATEITIKAGDVFDVLTGISASDSEDGDLTSSIKVEGSVNPNEEGSYSLTYSVTDQDDNTTTIERKVTIEAVQSDWENHWAAIEIKEAMENGWVNTVNQFRPNDSITRAEFVKVVNRAFGFTSKVNSESFTDVSNSHWFYDEVLIAIKVGYISTTQSTFRPNDSITREEAATIIARIKKIEDTNHDKLKKYSDYNKVSSWAINGVEGVIEKGYMGQGITAFRPKDNITRAEAVTTISRINNPIGIETSFHGAAIASENKLEIAAHISYDDNISAEIANINVNLVSTATGTSIQVNQKSNIDSLIKKIVIPIEQLMLNEEYKVMVDVNGSQEQLWMGNTTSYSYQSGNQKIIVMNKNKVLTIKREQVSETTGKISAVSIHGENLGIDTNYQSATELVLFKDGIKTNEVALVSKNNLKKLNNANKGIKLSNLVDGTYQIAIKDNTGSFYNLTSSQSKNTKYTAYTVRRNNQLKKVVVDGSNGNLPTLTVTTQAANSTNIADVILDPGHGGDYNPGVADSGACSPISGIACEHTEMLSLMKMVRQGLESHGLKVAMTREFNYAGGKLPLYGQNSRTDKVYNSGAKVTISSHYNSAGSSNRGAFAMHAMQDTNDLANRIVSNLSSVANQPKDLNQYTACDVTKKTGDGTSYGYDNTSPTSDCYYMIREYGGNITNGKNKDANGNLYREQYLTSEPVLVEYFNGANYTDANNFKNNKTNYANSVVKAIVEYFGITYKKNLISEHVELYELDTYNYEAIDNLK